MRFLPTSALDRAGGLLVLCLAGVLGSAPIRHSDFWRHLATGRALLMGTPLGSEPFSYAADDALWVNPAWLADIGLYLLFNVLGDGIVAVQAFFVVLTAGLMLWAAPASRLTTLAVALGLVALAPLMALRPALISWALTAFFYGWLERTADDGAARTTVTANWPLVLAMLVWVNCDGWFVLGPLLVALACIDRPRLGWTLMACSIACLANPFHLRVFAMATEWWASFGSAPFAAAWDWSAWARPEAAPRWAMALLVLVGGLSFALNRARLRLGRLALWLVLLALALLSETALPWFVIVTAPLLARNVWEWRTEHGAAERSGFGGAAPVFLLLGLLALAWPGWLQGTAEPPAWRVVADPSLEKAATRLTQWRAEGRLAPEARVLAFSLDAAHHLEWFAPGERVFVDGRTGRYPPAHVQTLQAWRDGLGVDAADDRATLDAWSVTHVLVHDFSDRTLTGMLHRLWRADHAWRMEAIDGRAVLFARRPGDRPSTELDLDAPAFGRDTSGAVRREGPAIGAEGKGGGGGGFATPQVAPEEARAAESIPAWLAPLLTRSTAGRADQDEALVFLAYFDGQLPRVRAQQRVGWEALLAASAVAAGASTTPHAAALTEIPWRRVWARASRSAVDDDADTLTGHLIVEYLRRRDDGPPAALWLAIRAARRALHADPGNAEAWLRLGQAYDRLARLTSERASAYPLLHRMRRVQTFSALQRAARLKPDLAAAHETLARLYQEDRILDLALVHLQRQIALNRRAGPRPQESRVQFAVRLQAAETQAQRLGKEVRELLNWSEAVSFNFDPHVKARLADSKGLSRRALQILLRATYGELGRDGALLEYNLLLTHGQIEDARAWLEPEQQAALGASSYFWLEAQGAAAAGDYVEADRALQQVEAASAAVDVVEWGLRRAEPRLAIALVFGKRLLDQTAPHPLIGRDPPAALVERLAGYERALRTQAELATLRGLLALEYGAIEAAHKHLAAAVQAGGGALPRRYLDLLR